MPDTPTASAATIRPRRGDLEAATQPHPFRPSGEYAGASRAEVCDLCGLAQRGSRIHQENALDGATLERIMHEALRVGDVKGVHAALSVMATTDPRRAERLLGTLQDALAVAQINDLDDGTAS